LRQTQSEVKDGQEFTIQPAMTKMIDDGKELLAYQIKNSKYYDTGNKLEYLKTVVDFALRNEEIKDDFFEYLKKVVK
jgi:UTP--glucose-1-phosphate uridylyltransferase